MSFFLAHLFVSPRSCAYDSDVSPKSIGPFPLQSHFSFPLPYLHPLVLTPNNRMVYIDGKTTPSGRRTQVCITILVHVSRQVLLIDKEHSHNLQVGKDFVASNTTSTITIHTSKASPPPPPIDRWHILIRWNAAIVVGSPLAARQFFLLETAVDSISRCSHK